MAIKYYALNDELYYFLMSSKDLREAWQHIAEKMGFVAKTINILDSGEPEKVIFSAEPLPATGPTHNFPTINVGRFTLTQTPTIGINIRDNVSGEAGSFNEALVEASLQEFFDKHF